MTAKTDVPQYCVITFFGDVITQQEAPWHAGRFSGVFKYWAHGGNEIENIVADNVRIDEFRDKSKGCVFQLRTEFRFDGEHPGKAMRNIVFRNIKVENTDEVPSLIKGFSESSPIEGVVFENYTRGGKKVETIKDCNVIVEGEVSNISIK